MLYSTIHHEVRLYFKMTLTEYAVIQAIQLLSSSQKHDNWCFASKSSIADMLGLSKTMVVDTVKKFDHLLIKSDKGKKLRCTDEWNDVHLLKGTGLLVNQTTEKAGLLGTDEAGIGQPNDRGRSTKRPRSVAQTTESVNQTTAILKEQENTIKGISKERDETDFPSLQVSTSDTPPPLTAKTETASNPPPTPSRENICQKTGRPYPKYFSTPSRRAIFDKLVPFNDAPDSDLPSPLHRTVWWIENEVADGFYSIADVDTINQEVLDWLATSDLVRNATSYKSLREAVGRFISSKLKR